MLSPKGKAPVGHLVTRCHNLQPDFTAKGVILKPAAALRPKFFAGWHPLVEVTVDNLGNSVIICRKSNSIAIVDRLSVVSQIELPDEPVCATPCHGFAWVCTKNNIYKVVVSADSLSLISPKRPKTPRLYVESYAGLQAQFGSLKFSKSYELSTQPTPADIRLISQSMRNLYNSLDSSARKAGAWWQPALMRIVLRNRDGQIVMKSPVTLISHPEGEQYKGVIELQSDDQRTTLPTTVQAPAWLVKLNIPEDAASTYSDIATLEVVASPAMHSVDILSQWNLAMRQRADTPYFCRAWASDSPTSIAPDSPASSANLIQNLITRFDSLGKVVLTINNPASLAGQSIAVPNPINANVKNDNTSLLKQLNRPGKHISPENALLGIPHTFAAQHTASAGGTTIWGDITVSRFAGFPAENFASVVTAQSWHAAAKVDFADGSSSVVVSQGSDHAPMKFNPVISYPSPDAVRITLTVSTNGETRCGVFELSPQSDGTATCISSQFSPQPLPEIIENFIIPAENPVKCRMSDCFIAAAASSPTLPVSVAQLPGASINAIVPSHNGQSAWDFGRTRFYAMTSEGIYTLGIPANRNSISFNLIDRRAVKTPYAVADAGSSVYAIADGSILELSGSKSKTFHESTATALAWNNRRGELWCIPDNGGEIEIICPDYDNCRYTISSEISPRFTTNLNSKTYIGSESTSYVLGEEGQIFISSIEWSSDTSFDKPLKQTAYICADMEGSVAELNITASRANLFRSTPSPDASQTVKGEIRSPLRRKVFTLNRPCWRFTITGNVEQSFAFHSITLSDQWK